jgi:hypothetical protein
MIGHRFELPVIGYPATWMSARGGGAAVGIRGDVLPPREGY